MSDERKAKCDHLGHRHRVEWGSVVVTIECVDCERVCFVAKAALKDD